jgi:3-oxoacyl-[acyl-carrier-protein] synthase-3
MAALYFTGDRPEPMPMREVDRVWDSGLGVPIPLVTAFDTGGRRIVGTTLDYFEFRGLGIAEGLIQTEQASRILLLTAETYSKYIDPADRSLRTIFSDAAAATLIETSPERSLSAFCYGTDGSGADTLLVRDGGARPLADAHQPRHRVRWKSRLYMDGPSLLGFTIVAVPNLIEQILAKTRPALSSDDIHLYLMHQATAKMLEQLQQRLGLSDHQLPIRLRECGNTVSCTLPILIDQMRSEGRLTPDQQTMLIGFGVGWSWGGCLWRDTHTASK